jgi:hypothetical protein
MRDALGEALENVQLAENLRVASKCIVEIGHLSRALTGHKSLLAAQRVDPQ